MAKAGVGVSLNLIFKRKLFNILHKMLFTIEKHFFIKPILNNQNPSANVIRIN